LPFVEKSAANLSNPHVTFGFTTLHLS